MEVARKLVSNVLRASAPSLVEIEEAIVTYFNKRVVPVNRKRENLRGERGEGTYARSLLRGLFTVRGTGLAKATRSHSDLVRLCHLLGRKRPHAMQFQYMSIMVNDNLVVPYHVDANNVGASCLRSLGDFVGGDFYQTSDHACCGETPHGSNKHAFSCPTAKHWIMFDAHSPHGISLVTGRRLSVAFFMPVRFDKIEDKLRKELIDFGFPLDLALSDITDGGSALPLVVKDDLPSAAVGSALPSAGGETCRLRRARNRQRHTPPRSEQATSRTRSTTLGKLLQAECGLQTRRRCCAHWTCSFKLPAVLSPTFDADAEFDGFCRTQLFLL
eukprot:148835-Amphidinium_carterae.1